MKVPLLRTFDDWYCPNCGHTERAAAAPRNGTGSARFHTCPGLHMLTAPLILAGTRCKVEAEERADYLRGEVQAAGDDGKPYMAVRATYSDHDDLLVNAGLAQARPGGTR